MSTIGDLNVKELRQLASDLGIDPTGLSKSQLLEACVQVLGTGGSGCVIAPAYSCGDYSFIKDKVSKIQLNTVDQIGHELKASELLGGYTDFFITAEITCPISEDLLPEKCSDIRENLTRYKGLPDTRSIEDYYREELTDEDLELWELDHEESVYRSSLISAVNNGLVNMVMKRADGPVLTSYINAIIREEILLDLNEIIRCVHGVFQGLSIIHSLGYVQGDVAARNIIYDDGRWKLIDFGRFVNTDDMYAKKSPKDKTPFPMTGEYGVDRLTNPFWGSPIFRSVSKTIRDSDIKELSKMDRVSYYTMNLDNYISEIRSVPDLFAPFLTVNLLQVALSDPTVKGQPIIPRIEGIGSKQAVEIFATSRMFVEILALLTIQCENQILPQLSNVKKLLDIFYPAMSLVPIRRPSAASICEYLRPSSRKK